MGVSPIIVWFRNDLRIADNPALRHAVDSGRPIIPLFIWASAEEGDWPIGGASKWWLHHSLISLTKSLKACGSQLIIRSGNSQTVLQEAIKLTGAKTIYWNRRYEPAIIERDKALKAVLKENDIEVKSFNGALLHEPWTITNKSGAPYQVFTPFWKTCLSVDEPDAPLPTPRKLTSPNEWPNSETVDDLSLNPKLDWANEFPDHWSPGESGAQKNLRTFIKDAVSNYSEDRNRPDRCGTSQLSPHLHFGEISPRQIWSAVKDNAERNDPDGNWKRSQFLAEIGWREFAHHLLFHFPDTPHTELREPFRVFPWRNERDWLTAWQRGQTGYPIVDAGMRQLWKSGWMHNRVRMIVGSFLVKDLLLDWRKGAAWFWDTLVDADLANNTLGWQWISGCGADAAPYFRVFNPTSQGEKFDPNGDYVRTWVPELSALPNKWIHRPFEAPAEILDHANIRLGSNYPKPIVNHNIARELALEAYQGTKR